MIDEKKLIEEVKKQYFAFVHDDTDLWWNRAISAAIEIIESQPPADQWIPCSERLPDKGGTYIVTQERYRLDDRLYKKPVVVETAFAEFNFMDDVWNRARHLKVTAWMPLTEPFKGEENA